MKKHIITCLLLCMPLLFSCSDEIPYGERYENLPPVEPKRHILIEDFTGQKCSNCPEAHKVIHELKALYGEYVIAVAIHAGHFGIAENSKPGIIGLMQPEGNTYANSWGIETYPAGIINRASGILKHSDWPAYARQALTEPTNFEITLACEVIADSIVINTTTLPSSNTNDKMLQLWITESNVIAPQLNGKNEENNYINQHVYRASVNGSWGEKISLQEKVPHHTIHKIKVRDNWEIGHLSVIAFIYDEKDNSIQEACEFPLNTNK